MTRKRAILTLAALIGFATTLAIAGCKITPLIPVNRSAPVTQPAAAVQQHLGTISTEHAAALSDLAPVIKAPTLPPALLPPLKSADAHVVVAEQHTRAATTQMVALQKAADTWTKQDLVTQGQLRDAQIEINKLKSQFWSPRQIKDAWIIGLSFGTYVLVLGVIKNFGGAVPALVVVYHLMLTPITLGFNLIHAGGQGIGWCLRKLAAWLTAKEVALKAKLASAAPKAATV